MTPSPMNDALIAYLYDELSPSEHAAFESSLAEHPELRAEADRLGWMRRQFRLAFADVPLREGLMDAVLAEARRVAEQFRRAAATPTLWERVRAWITQPAFAMTAMAALVLAVGVVMLNRPELEHADSPNAQQIHDSTPRLASAESPAPAKSEPPAPETLAAPAPLVVSRSDEPAPAGRDELEEASEGEAAAAPAEQAAPTDADEVPAKLVVEAAEVQATEPPASSQLLDPRTTERAAPPRPARPSGAKASAAPESKPRPEPSGYVGTTRAAGDGARKDLEGGSAGTLDTAVGSGGGAAARRRHATGGAAGQPVTDALEKGAAAAPENDGGRRAAPPASPSGGEALHDASRSFELGRATTGSGEAAEKRKEEKAPAPPPSNTKAPAPEVAKPENRGAAPAEPPAARPAAPSGPAAPDRAASDERDFGDDELEEAPAPQRAAPTTAPPRRESTSDTAVTRKADDSSLGARRAVEEEQARELEARVRALWAQYDAELARGELDRADKTLAEIERLRGTSDRTREARKTVVERRASRSATPAPADAPATKSTY